jgi:hypothetical protein
MAFTFRGESGKTLGTADRAAEDLNITDWKLTFSNLADDTLSWTAKTRNATGAGTIVPDPGQVVELWEGGVRKFKGWAAFPKAGLDSVQVQARGPWWFLQREPLTSILEDGTGATGERTSFVFPTQSLRASIIDLLNRAIALGVPMSLGTIATMYAVPKISLSNMTFGAALAELLRWCPDCVAWFDYSVAGEPALNITRRSGMTALTLAVGNNVEAANVYPRLDQEVSRVELKYVDRVATTGRPRWQSQVAGSAVIGKRQIITVSGPEIAAFLPKDDFDSVQVQTVEWSAITDAFVKARDGGLASISASVGAVFGTVAASFIYYTGSTSDNKTQVIARVPGLLRSSDTGAAFPAGTVNLVISPTPLPEWAQKSLGAMPVTVTGTWVASWKDSLRGVNSSWNSVFQAMSAGATTYLSKWENGAETGSTKDYTVDYIARPFQVTGYLIDTAFPSLTTVYKPWDYDYLSPPAGLADNLRASQAWVPWEGSVTVVADEVSGDNSLNRKVRLSNAAADAATMDALLKSVSHDSRGRTTYELGAADRTDFGSLVNRIRREPSDNIVYL